jgi:hypothetical protein
MGNRIDEEEHVQGAKFWIKLCQKLFNGAGLVRLHRHDRQTSQSIPLIFVLPFFERIFFLLNDYLNFTTNHMKTGWVGLEKC